MSERIGFLSTYPPRVCGIGKYTGGLGTGLFKLGHEVRVGAICRDEPSELYENPVVVTMGQDEPIEAWEREISHMLDMGLDIFGIQHEYGIGHKDHFVAAAKRVKTKVPFLLTYLHTVPSEPDDYEKETLQELSKYSDSFVVHTRHAVELLKSPVYGIKTQVKRINHGVRMLNPGIYDRLNIKKKYRAMDYSDSSNPKPLFLIVSLGLRGPNKGHNYGARALARFYDACTEEQRNRIKWLIAGPGHPELIKIEGGKKYKEYESGLKRTIGDCGLRTPDEYYKSLHGIDWENNDVIVVDKLLTEEELREGYTMGNIIIMLYPGEQSGSGIFADALGSRRIALATKCLDSAVEQLNIKDAKKPGVRGIGDPLARGFLVDPGEASVEQAAEVIDYLTLDKQGQLERSLYEERAHEGGFDDRWDMSAWRMMHHVEFLREKTKIVNGRAQKFTRKKPSPFE